MAQDALALSGLVAWKALVILCPVMAWVDLALWLVAGEAFTLSELVVA